MMKKIFVLVSIGLIAACGRPYRIDKVSDAPQEKEKILILDHGLLFYLNVVKQAQERLDSGQMVVKFEIENEEDKDAWCDVQVIFRGPDGFEVEKTDWQPQLFHRRMVTLVQKTSLSPKATDYRILIRNAH